MDDPTPDAGTLLLVEDDPNDILFFQRAAKQAALPNPITVAPDGATAVAYLSGPAGPPSLVVLDWKMPGLDGLDVLLWIRRQPALRRLPVVVLTSSSNEADKAAAARAGASAYLVKPASPRELPELIQFMQRVWLRSE